MSDATITRLTPRPLRAAEPRNCGAARVIELPARRTGRIIEPLDVAPSPRAGEAPGPLARALMAMAAADR